MWCTRGFWFDWQGHAAPILYAAWAEAGLFPTSELLKLRKIESDLEGHPTPVSHAAALIQDLNEWDLGSLKHMHSILYFSYLLLQLILSKQHQPELPINS